MAQSTPRRSSFSRAQKNKGKTKKERRKKMKKRREKSGRIGRRGRGRRNNATGEGSEGRGGFRYSGVRLSSPVQVDSLRMDRAAGQAGQAGGRGQGQSTTEARDPSLYCRSAAVR
jgi:hypothetical protein